METQELNDLLGEVTWREIKMLLAEVEGRKEIVRRQFVIMQSDSHDRDKDIDFLERIRRALADYLATKDDDEGGVLCPTERGEEPCAVLGVTKERKGE